MLSNFYKKRLDELITNAKINLSAKKVNENVIADAFKFALEAHKNDKRASGEPYFTHPYEVALILAKEIPIDDVTIASSLLHDVVEDTKFTINDIRAEFGDTIADIVDGATQIEGLIENYELKQIESYKKMLLSMTSDLRVMLIKFADRLHNLRTLEFLSNARQYRMAQETLDIYAPLAHRFGLSKLKSELEDLSFKYLNRNEYDKIAHHLKEKKRERERFLKKFIEPIRKQLDESGYKYEIFSRAKHIYSIYQKLKKREKGFEDIYDLHAVRIILDTQSPFDCFTVYGYVAQLYVPIPERFKNFISVPKSNGYQSLHTTVMSSDGKRVEVQIRTRDMNEIAEKGIAAHWKYKESQNINDEKIEQWMKNIRDTFENASKDELTTGQLIENFRLELFQNEIYCFTPKGELKILPAGATPVDFAFAIHTEVGMKCIGAKVNNKIVPLNTALRSGNQVEIITSKIQKPKKDWEKFVVTHKAQSDIKKYFNLERRNMIAKGREIYEKKLKKHKLHINDDNLQKILQPLKFKDLQNFFINIANEPDKVNMIIEYIENRKKVQEMETQSSLQSSAAAEAKEAEIQERFSKETHDTSKILSLGKGENKTSIPGIKYKFAKCCNPIPGDDVIGYVTQTEGIKIHRKNCSNIINLYLLEPERIVEINLSDTKGTMFTGGIKIIGEDKPGILNDITETLSKNFKVNIKSVNIFTKGSMFEGTLIIEIENLSQLNSVIEKINSHKGVFSAARFLG